MIRVCSLLVLVAVVALNASGALASQPLVVYTDGEHGIPTTLTNGVNIERCNSILLEDISRDSFYTNETSVAPRYLTLPHPDIQRSTDFFVVWDCIVDEHARSGKRHLLDMIVAEKHVYAVLMVQEKAEQNKGAISRRFLHGDNFMAGLWDALRQQASSDGRGLLTGGVFSCVSGVQSTARDLYGYFRNRNPSLFSTIRTVAQTVYNCLSVATTGTPIGWVRGIIRVARAVYNAATIAQRCGALITSLQSATFNSREVGFNTGRCVNAIASVLSRRRRDDIDVPSTWVCLPENYAAFDGCDIECGAYDPDCDDAEQPVFFRDSLHIEYAPENWECPSSFYNGTDGCDVGCGAVDPDCSQPATSVRPNTTFVFESPVALMSVAAQNAYDDIVEEGRALRTGASVSNDSNKHTFSTTGLILVVAGTALLASLATVGVVALLVKSKRRRTSNHHLLSTSSSAIDEDASYGLQL